MADNLNKIKIISWNMLNQADRQKLLKRDNIKLQKDLKDKVSEIIQKVRKEGDEALKYYTELFDGVKQDEWEESVKLGEKLEKSTKQAIDCAYQNIKRFHELQRPLTIRLNQDGVESWRVYSAIPKVGLYIPGGTAPLISTLLMLAIPATIAGCQEIIVTTPPSKNGGINAAIKYAASLCGITQLYKVGGAQAIAALAYGTKSIPKVMKIFGPGNRYVTEAKLQVAQDPDGAALDMPAGPSEVLVIADDTANPEFVASDLLAQAEHDVDAKAILVTPSLALAEKVNAAINDQRQTLSRQAILEKSLINALIIVTKDLEEAFSLSNLYCPEHLLVQVNNPKNYISMIQNAGSVFLGPWSAEALGDYASGPNHVLPTYGYAKNYGGLGVESFMKSITFQEISQEGLQKLAKTVEKLADLEGLDGHKLSVVIRRKKIEGCL